MTAALLDIDALHAGYGNGDVVRALSLQVRPGEVVALLGPNGAGKTTLLRAVSGLLAPSAGAIRFAGHDVRGTSPQKLARWGMAHVMEGHSVFPALTVEEHFRLRPRGLRLDRAVALDYFPALADLGNRRAGLLSGGEQQMLALAQALARRPALLLIDELSLGLAPVIVERLLPIIRRFADENQAAVLLVEQRVHLALEIADRGCLLVHGSLHIDQPAHRLREDRALITASYLGGNSSTTPGGDVGRVHPSATDKETHVPPPLA